MDLQRAARTRTRSDREKGRNPRFDKCETGPFVLQVCQLGSAALISERDGPPESGGIHARAWLSFDRRADTVQTAADEDALCPDTSPRPFRC